MPVILAESKVEETKALRLPILQSKFESLTKEVEDNIEQ